MTDRIKLHNLLTSVVRSRNVYFQPPESIKMKYPAIVYSRNDIESDFADNLSYLRHHEYELVVIDDDPDSEIVEKVAALPACRFVRHYTADNLNHDVFTIYI